MGPNSGLKHRGNKLHNFVVGEGGDEEYQTALVTQDETEAQNHGIVGKDQPQTSRQEVADALRLSMPQARHAARHLRERSLASQQNSQSPVRSRHESPRPTPSRTETSDHFNGLFAPSILGDDFMRSEASTPLPPSDEQDENAVSRRRSEAHTKKPPRWSSGRQHAVGETVKFVTNDDGFMQVVKSGQKYTPTAMRDGFTRDNYYERKRTDQYEDGRILPSLTAERHAGLPIRTEPRRSTKGKEERVFHSARSPTPVRQTAGDEWTPEMEARGRRSPQRYKETTRPPPSDTSESEMMVTARARRADTDIYGGTAQVEEPTQYSMREGSRLRKRHRESLDYDDQILSAMSYKDLRNEAFDFDPSKAALAGVSSDGTLDLPTKLEQRRRRGEEEQRQFFASMPMKEWEESGDWFVDQFAALMTKMRDARREKRRVIQAFEEEAERREEIVRTRSEAIDRKLGKMKQDGLKVVGDVSS